jgi:hypothetical protein
MQLLEIRSQDVRLPAEALEALEHDAAVVVTHYGRRRHVVLSEERFALVAPLLELLDEGVRVPAEMLMTASEIDLERALAEDREPAPGEEALIDATLDQLS